MKSQKSFSRSLVLLVISIFFVLFLSFHGTALAYNVAYIYGNAEAQNTAPDYLNGHFDSVTNIDGDAETLPSLAELLAYDAIMVSPNWFWTYAKRSDDLGNLLADYVDAGGGLVMTMFSWQVPGVNDLRGRLLSGGYSPFVGGSSLYSYASLGSFTAHPIMSGVNTIEGYFRDAVTLSNDAQSIATWSDGVPFVAIDKTSGVVGINLFPEDFYGEISGDYATLFINALNWAAGHKGKYYKITVALNPQEGGTVSSSPAGLTCSGNICQGSFIQGTKVFLTPNPKDGWKFRNWDDGIANYAQNPWVITMDENISVSAAFDFITKSKHGWGWLVTIDGMEIGASYFPTWPDLFSAYLCEAISPEWQVKIMAKLGPISPFSWSRNIPKTNEAVNLLYEKIKELNKTNRPITILSHSWGTVLAYIALMKHEDIHIDKLITLGSPLDSSFDPIADFTHHQLKNFGINTTSKPSNVREWHNYFAVCDPVSGSVSAIGKKENYMNRTIYPTIFACHASYFNDNKKWDKILQDVISK